MSVFFGQVWPQYWSNSPITIYLEPLTWRGLEYCIPSTLFSSTSFPIRSACHGLLPCNMNDESPSLNSREECGPAGRATNLLHSAVTKRGFFLRFLQRPSLFKPIVILLEMLHLFIISTQCYRISVLVALILAQL
jgi:hypothetical protein